MPTDPNAEEIYTQKITEIIFEDYDDGGGPLPRIQWAFNEYGITQPAPIRLTGYVDSIVAKSRDEAATIKVWCDSVATVRTGKQSPVALPSRSYNIYYEQVTMGILYTYSVQNEQVGSHKRIVGEILRDMMYSLIHKKIPTAHKIDVISDYRFGSDRMSGGSRRGLRGNVRDKGNLKESFTTGVTFEVKREVRTFFC